MPRKAVGDVLREHRNLKLDPADVDDLGGGTTAPECHRDVHLILGFWKIASSSVDPGLCADAPATPHRSGRCGQRREKGWDARPTEPVQNRPRDAARAAPVVPRLLATTGLRLASLRDRVRFGPLCHTHQCYGL
jgi:hypothetical protein